MAPTIGRLALDNGFHGSIPGDWVAPPPQNIQMENVHPNVGYVVLAYLLVKTVHNVVITTNFDHLLEDALNYYEKSLPLVIGHIGDALPLPGGHFFAELLIVFSFFLHTE